ncbi:hypothetical protein GGI12_005268, partial [Dipsacomyces acuminosporus]
AYLQLCKAEWQLSRAMSTGVSPTGCLPALVYENEVVESGFWHIVEFLKREGYDLDEGLDEEQRAQSIAYISLIQDSLVDALLFSWYLVSENFAEAIRPRLAKLIGLPFSLLVPTQLKDYAQQRLEAHGMLEAKETDGASKSQESSATTGGLLKNKLSRISLLAKEGFKRHADRSAHPIYELANKCLDVLSSKLDNKNYFFGEHPTTLDTVAYGYLSLILYPELPQATLKSIVTLKYPNLAEFCDRMHSRTEKPSVLVEGSWVGSVGSMLKQEICRYTTLPSLPIRQGKADPQHATKVRSVVGAFCVFFGYVIYNGILSAPSSTSAAEPAQVEGVDLDSVLAEVRNVFNQN